MDGPMPDPATLDDDDDVVCPSISTIPCNGFLADILSTAP